MQSPFDDAPHVCVPVNARARLKRIHRWSGVVVAPIPFAKLLPFLIAELRLQGLEFYGWNSFRKRPPSIAVAQEDDEIGPGRRLLAASNLAKTDFHGALVEAGFLAYSPAQVDRLES